MAKKCPSCGGILSTEDNTLYVCDNCGKKFRIEQKPKTQNDTSTPDSKYKASSVDTHILNTTEQSAQVSASIAKTPVQANATVTTTSAPDANSSNTVVAELLQRISQLEHEKVELENESQTVKDNGGHTKQRKKVDPKAVGAFFKKWWVAIVPSTLVAIILITLLSCLVGLRGVYVDVENPNNFYDFTAGKYYCSEIEDNLEFEENGSFSISKNKINFTINDPDFGKISDYADFKKIDGFKLIQIGEKQYKRISLVKKSVMKKIKVSIDLNGGTDTSGKISVGEQKLEVGTLIGEPETSPTCEDLNFIGWYPSPFGFVDKEKEIDLDKRLWEDTTAYANWLTKEPIATTYYGYGIEVKYGQNLYNIVEENFINYDQEIDSLYFKIDGDDNETKATPDTRMPAKSITITNISTQNRDLSNVPYVVQGETLKYVNPNTVGQFVIPTDVTAISETAFKDCDTITEIVIHEAVTLQTTTYRNPDGTLQYDSDGNAIMTCTLYNGKALKAITVAEGHSNFASQNGILYNKAKTNMYIIPQAIEGAITIPAATTKFASIQSVKNITSIAVESGNTMFKSEGNCIIRISNDALVMGCKASVIPSTVKSINNNAFAYADIESINIPATTTYVSFYAFSGCTNLSSITVEAGNTSYSSQNNCIIDKSKRLVIGCKNSVIPTDGSVTAISSYAFFNCSGLSSIVIPNTITSIGESAFENCTALTSITISDNIEEIGYYAFRECTGLSSVTFAGTQSIIEFDSLFCGCTSLTSIVIPASVRHISSYCFNGCTALTSVTFEDTINWERRFGYGSYYSVDVSDPSENASSLTDEYDYQKY